jgi:hypothetical protein
MQKKKKVGIQRHEGWSTAALEGILKRVLMWEKTSRKHSEFFRCLMDWKMD